ncbi:hypothetical protein [Amycolatopsis echigonensis]|uniref:Uncharacterized protein n=1 Tax=Amycolatopsis echigonensis TaxID=2576905 RepID=A0A8E1VXP4_9PSEU|nr:hypothetical protein [Amycolatopsis echigonensis]MBB2500260.1 hypothetical protein [Amycolatopsis echigonensis]
MAKTALVVKLELSGAREVLAAFRALSKDASDALRDHSGKLAQKLAGKAAADVAAHGGPQGKLVAPTTRVVRDRVPAIQIGGSRRVGRNRTPAYGVLFGSIFGMTVSSGWYRNARYNASTGRQYRVHRGIDAYAFFPVVEQNQATIAAEWHAAANQIVRDFNRGA